MWTVRRYRQCFADGGNRDVRGRSTVHSDCERVGQYGRHVDSHCGLDLKLRALYRSNRERPKRPSPSPPPARQIPPRRFSHGHGDPAGTTKHHSGMPSKVRQSAAHVELCQRHAISNGRAERHGNLDVRLYRSPVFRVAK